MASPGLPETCSLYVTYGRRSPNNCPRPSHATSLVGRDGRGIPDTAARSSHDFPPVLTSSTSLRRLTQIPGGKGFSHGTVSRQG